jgi:tetratricopeptide (TPR) repeat protein
LSLVSCVYFNTYYNAQKYFRQAEKARLEEEKATQGSRRNIQLGGRESPIAENTSSARRPQGRGTRSASSAKLYEKAVERASTVLEKYKDSDLIDDAMFLAGRSLYWQRDYRFAAQSFQDLATHFPQSEYSDEAMYWRGLCLEAQSDYGRAAAVYRSVLSTAGPQTAAKAGFRVGEIAYQEGNYPLAIQEYAATLESFPETDLRAELWLRIGETHTELTDRTRLDLALVAFDRVLEESPSDDIAYWARLNRGLVLHEMGDAEAARDAYLKLLKEGKYRSFEGKTRIVLGQYYQLEDQLGEALEQYEKVRDDFPQTESSAMALYRTGQLYLQEYSDRTRAEEYFREVAGEKGNSEGNVLAKQTLANLKELARTQRKIHRADSLAAARSSRKKIPPTLPEPDSLAIVTAKQDSAGMASEDTTSQLTTHLSGEESAARLRQALEADDGDWEEDTPWTPRSSALFSRSPKSTGSGSWPPILPPTTTKRSSGGFPLPARCLGRCTISPGSIWKCRTTWGKRDPCCRAWSMAIRKPCMPTPHAGFWSYPPTSPMKTLRSTSSAVSRRSEWKMSARSTPTCRCSIALRRATRMPTRL